jgi:hypothetical protein
MLIVMLLTAQRRSEVCTMPWQDVDLQNPLPGCRVGGIWYVWRRRLASHRFNPEGAAKRDIFVIDVDVRICATSRIIRAVRTPQRRYDNCVALQLDAYARHVRAVGTHFLGGVQKNVALSDSNTIKSSVGSLRTRRRAIWRSSTRSAMSFKRVFAIEIEASRRCGGKLSFNNAT